MVSGSRENAEALRERVASVLEPMGLRLSEEKTQVVHLDDGFDFLGFHIQRHLKRGTNRHYIYTYPAKKSVAAVMQKVRVLTYPNNLVLGALLQKLAWLLRGWCNYFKHGVSKRVFSYLDSYAWKRVAKWLRRRHKGMTWKEPRRRFCKNGWTISVAGIELYGPSSTPVSRYVYQGGKIPTPG